MEKLAKRVIDKGKVDDLVLLDTLTEAAIVEALRNRFASDLIYTSIGSVLISVNPFRQIQGLYSPGMVKAYSGALRYERAPHIYGLSEESYHALLKSGRNQCILVSGESGAGKTEAVKKILEYIAAVSPSVAEGGKSVASIKDKLLESNPLTEAFGNAKTLRNDNSSRFGKYMCVQFNYDGTPLGATIQTYLLEKPRVVFQQEGERNFHIFYQLISGARGSVRSELSLGSASEYKYLGTTLSVKGLNDEADFAEVDSALDALTSPEQKRFLYRVVAGVLHLGNVTFRGGDKCEAVGAENAAKCIEVELERLKKALTSRTIRTRGEAVVTPLKAEECLKTRDALAKGLYARMFRALITFLNDSLKSQQRVELTLGLLDVFGFEIFAKNSFEQLLINYCNERLQQIFVRLTLESEQAEYHAEGIAWKDFDYFNNAIVCTLIDGKNPAGVIAYCDEETIMPGANDKSLLGKLNSNLAKHPHYAVLTKDAKRGDSTEFCIKHYAGDVIYSTEGFVEKNQDILYRDLVELGGSSKNALIASVFPEAKEAHDLKKPVTSGSQFRSDMEDLVNTLLRCDPHYVRTIKPNDNKAAGVFDADRVAHQVRYLGLLENVRVRRAGFAYRQTYALFVHRYRMVCPAIWLKRPSPDTKGEAVKILEAMAVPRSAEGDAYALGKTKIFIRRPETLFALEEMRDRKMEDIAAMIQGAWRSYKARKYFLELREKSMGIFQGRKRRRNSWVLFFQGDYIFAKQSMELKALFEHPKLGAHDQKIIFADRCDVVAKRNRLEPRKVVFTEKSIYVADLAWKQPRRIDLRMVKDYTLSTFADGFVVIHVNQPLQTGKLTEPDLVLMTVRKAELITVLNERMNGAINLQFADTIPFNFKKVGLLSSKVLPGTLTFVESSAATTLCQLTQNDPANLAACTVVVSPALGSKAPLQLSSSAPERAIANLAGRAAAGFINHSDKRKNRGDASGGGQNARPVSNGNALVGSSMTPLSDLSGLKRAKILYDYKGSNQKDLNVNAGQVVHVITQHGDGWWDAQVDGRRGLFPGSYAELM